MNRDLLPQHSAFRRLSQDERILFSDAAEIWEAPEQAVVQYPGDAGEELILVLEGRLEGKVPNSSLPEFRGLPGDFWGNERLENPEPVEQELIAAVDTRWLRWPRDTLTSLFLAQPALARALTPRYDENNVLVSGLPGLKKPGGKKKRSGDRDAVRRQTLRGTLRPLWIYFALSMALALFLFVLTKRSDVFSSWIVLVAPGLFVFTAIPMLIKRSFREYTIDGESLSSRTLKLSRLVVESRFVPVDQVQGVETDRSGLIRRLLGYGTVSVKTSALEGELRMEGVNSPETIRKAILDRREIVLRRLKGQDRESMRRAMESGRQGSRFPRLVRPSLLPEVKGGSGGDTRFNKSAAVLFSRLLLPLLVSAAIILSAPLLPKLFSISSSYVYLIVLLPVLWALYRFEDWRNDIFLVTGGYAVDLDRKPLGIRETRRQIELSAVQNIRTEQRGVMSFLFRFGDVILVSVGGASDLVFEKVSRPWQVQEELFRLRERERRRQEDIKRLDRLNELTRFAEAMEQIKD